MDLKELSFDSSVKYIDLNKALSGLEGKPI